MLCTAQNLVRRRMLLRFAAIAPLAPLLAAAPARAATMPLRMVTVAVAPWGWSDAAGQPQGIFVDFARQLAAESGLAMTISVVPYPRAVAMIGVGDADLLLALNSAVLLRTARQVVATPIGDVIVVTRADLAVRTLQELRGKVVGQVRATEYGPEFDGDSLIGKREMASWEQCVKMLMEHRIDGAIGMRVSLLYAMQQLGLPRSQLGPELFVHHASASLHYSRRSYDPAVAAVLAAAVTRLNQRGVMHALMARVMPAVPAPPQAALAR